MAQEIFHLMVCNDTQHSELLRSEDQQTLRDCAPVLAQQTEAGDELMLINKDGITLAAYDVWTNEWQAAA